MSKVTFRYTNGRERAMDERSAKALSLMKRGTYMTRDMAAAPRLEAVIKPEPVRPSVVHNGGLDALDADELHALAKERGVKVHHKAGAEKVRDALREPAE